MDEKTGQEATLEEVNAKLADLTKGIASYRDTAQKAESSAAEAKAEAAAAKKEAADAKAESEDLRNSKKYNKEPQLNPEDQARLEAWAKKQGFVTKAEMEAQRVSLLNESVKGAETTAVEEFLENHPEYSESDKWEAVKKQFEQYKQPTSLTGYRNILSRIHKDLSQKDDIASELRAREEQKKRLGLGGKGANEDGDGDVTMEKMRQRYPNLSEETITQRLIEINELAGDRAKKRAAKK